MTMPAWTRSPLSRRPALAALLVVPMLVLGVVVAVALRGSASDASANGSVPVTSTDQLQGRWAAVNDAGAPTGLSAAVELEVDGDTLLVRTGCNTGSTRVAVEDSRLRLVDDGLAVTEMGCDIGRMRQEGWVLDMLRDEPVLARSGPFLSLTWNDGRWWLGFEPATDP